MHDVAVFRITAEDIGDNLTERHREYTLVDVLYRVVYVFLRGTHATHHISVVHKKSLSLSPGLRFRHFHDKRRRQFD